RPYDPTWGPRRPARRQGRESRRPHYRRRVPTRLREGPPRRDVSQRVSRPPPDQAPCETFTTARHSTRAAWHRPVPCRTVPERAHPRTGNGSGLVRLGGRVDGPGADDPVHPQGGFLDLFMRGQRLRRPPHLVEPAHTDLGDDPPDEARALRVLLHLQVDA